MKITKIEASFTREEYERQKEFNEKGNCSPCRAVQCDGISLACDVCPLNYLTRKEALEYIKNHLE